MKITDIKMRRIFKEGKMKAIYSITFDDLLVVHDIKLIQAEDKYFLSMPSRRLDCGDYVDIVHPINKEMRTMIEKKILEDYLEKKIKLKI